MVVDVGCRWGFAAVWEQLGDHCEIVGFDPDVAECERLRRHYRAVPQVQVVALALGAATGPATLHVTKDPSGYSLYPTVTDVVERFPALAGGQVEHTLEIALTTLDEWCATAGRDRVDVIKIDTQGSELEVLKVRPGHSPPCAPSRSRSSSTRSMRAWPCSATSTGSCVTMGSYCGGRDLAHYAQVGSATELRAQETQHYDGYQARYHAGAGQLFWANAYFVKADVAAPRPAVGWQQLVRDACVTSALGFGDLTGVAVEHALAGAPAEVAGALALASSQERLAARRQAELAEGSEALEGSITIEVDDPKFQGPGWLPAQRIELGAVRWSGPAREASVDLPVVLRPGARVELLSFGAMSPEIIESLALEVNRVRVPLERSIVGTSILYAGTLPDHYASKRPFTRLLVRTCETIPWNEANPDSTDDTELGFALSWVRLTAP